jgi:3-methylfumaryl-CoA hydratase
MGDAAPLLSHWMTFLEYPLLDQVGPDGHARRGDFLPPVALPRRMWAGSTLTFSRPLQVGVPLVRRSTIGSVVEKEGRTGRLVFVSVDHEVHDHQGLVLTDRHDIVYREAASRGSQAPKPQPALADPQWRRVIKPDPVLLFRYSALTFNGHRIHYDREYAIGEEGYPGLVVHGPMIATFLLHEMVHTVPDAIVTGFTFRAVKPIFDTSSFSVCGALERDGVAQLFASDESGALCMSATATFS